jgi:cell division protein FtsI (penicillin-binding protein 3)
VSATKEILWRVYIVYIGFFLALMAVLYKTYTIQNEQVTDVFETETPTEKIPTRLVKRIPRRGEILDINHTPLVTSVSFFDIHMDATVPSQKVFDKEIGDLARGLSELFPEMSAREYENHIRQGRARKNRYLLIKRRATNEQRRKIRELPIFKLGRFKGGLIDNEETVLRKRPNGELANRTLGYYQNNGGKELRVGIEGAFHSFLSGSEGEEIEQKISTGWKKTGQVVKEAVEGADIITSLDKEIQEVAHAELYRQLEKTNAISGSVIVMDVKTGFVRAVVNLSRKNESGYAELYNHAIGTREVPGSTFKLASLMAALEDKKISVNDTVLATPKYTFFDKTITEAHEYNYGRITIKQAFEKSSNVFSKIIYNAYKNEPQSFVDRLRSFGFGEPLGIDLQGEPNPTLYAPGSKYWWGGSLAWMSIGYEVQQTPLQMLTFYNAVANKGKMVKPQFVEEIKRGSELVKKFEPIVMKEKICSDNTLRILQECLEGVMKYGTGKNLKSSYFEVAGKTGTAEILNDNLKYGNKGEKRYLASYIGYFPVDNPMYSCIVSISANGDNIYGATVSGTVFSAIANKVYANSLKYHDAINEQKREAQMAPISMNGNRYDLMKILQKLNIQFQQLSEDEWVSTKVVEQKIEFHQRFIGKNTIPNVLGMSAKDAVYLIENKGIHVKISGHGKVIKQSIPAGKAVGPYKGGLMEISLEP